MLKLRRDSSQRSTVIQSGLNTTQKDIQALTQRVGAVVSDAQGESKTRFARLRKEQNSQAMMSMMIGMMTQTQIQKQLAGHTHDGATLPKGAPSGTAPTLLSSSDNSMLMMLPMMMMDLGQEEAMTTT